MKIKNIEIQNFRGIDDATLYLNGKSTVFYGVNGVGKTTILNAIDLLYSSIINKIVQNRFKQGMQIQKSDVKFGRGECAIGADFIFAEENEVVSYHRRMRKGDAKRFQSATGLARIESIFKENYLDGEKGMPIFVNYGVNRTVIDIPLRIRNAHIFDKESAFEKAIESKIDFRTFFEWFRYQEDLENQIKVRENMKYEDVALKSVKAAIYSMFEDVSNMRIERNPLAMKLEKNGISLQVDQLSDGEKCTIALFGDLSRRLTLANPRASNPLLGTGVVLIDEIELHMHPLWQRRILPTLKKCFPNIQFVVTTHSPQVLGELGEEYIIYSIEKEGDRVAYKTIPSLIGWDSNYILKCFMETDNLNAGTQKLIEEIFDAIMQKDYDKAEALVEKLEKMTDTAQEDAVKARTLIRRGRSA